MKNALIGLGVVMLASAPLTAPTPMVASSPLGTPIRHVIVVVKENHTFDNYFGQFPGADGARMVTIQGVPQSPPRAADRTRDINHSFASAHMAFHDGKMDRFERVPGAIVNDVPLAFAQYTEEDIPAYWTYARQFVLFDRYFTSVMGPSTPNHLFLVAASSGGAIGNPRRTAGQPACAASNAVIDVLLPSGKTTPVRACLDMPSLPNLLSQRGVAWKAYGYWAMGILHRIYDDPEMRRHLTTEEEIVSDLRNRTLPAVSWIAPSRDEHPPHSICEGERSTVQLVNAVMTSAYWTSSLILVTWDDWGGWYDHVPPPQVDPLGLGFRVPMLAISPYAKQGYISHQQTDHVSVVKTLEVLLGLPSLTNRDAQASDLLDALDFSHSPRLGRPVKPRPCISG